MDDQRLSIVEDGDCLCEVPISSIANNGFYYENTGTITITPGYNPFAIYRESSSAQYPIDKYATHLKVNPDSILQVHSKVVVERVIQVKAVSESIWNRVKSRFGDKKDSVESKVERTLCQVHILTRDSNVFCGPSKIPKDLLSMVDTKSSFILENDLTIFPDYSNLGDNIVTTPDLFAIQIKKGSEIILEEGGSIGNIKITLRDGMIVVNCNQDLYVPDCLCIAGQDNKLLNNSGKFIEG